MEMEEVANDVENPDALILINTVRILSKNMMEEAHDVLEAIGARSDCEDPIRPPRLRTDLIGTPGQSTSNTQGDGCNSILMMAAAGAIMAMECNGGRNVIRRLTHLVRVCIPDRLFSSSAPAELADQNFLPILTNMLKSEDCTLVENPVKNRPPGEALMIDYCKYKEQKVAKASVAFGGVKRQRTLSEGGVYEHKNR